MASRTLHDQTDKRSHALRIEHLLESVKHRLHVSNKDLELDFEHGHVCHLDRFEICKKVLEYWSEITEEFDDFEVVQVFVAG